MYTDKKNILQLVALLEAHGITKVVLCPGSRNAPIVHTLSNHPGFTCYAMTDERSAGYFAIGLTLNGGKPAAICCTSGTALLNLHPAVAEAFYQNVPLVVISADRPAAWIGQMDGQTLPQPDVFPRFIQRKTNGIVIVWLMRLYWRHIIMGKDRYISMCLFPNRCFSLQWTNCRKCVLSPVIRD